METKRIQLRGISRSPSDRLTEDGGCAESLNVYLDNDEVAPAVAPEDITEQTGLAADRKFDKVFIHKTQTKENYIGLDSSYIGYYLDGVFTPIITLNDEKVADIASVGNSLIVTTDKSMHYALFTNGKYIYLGTEIPAPVVNFECVHSYQNQVPTTGLTLFNNRSGAHDPVDSTPTPIKSLDVDAWMQAIDDIKYGLSNDNTVELNEIQREFWALINQKIKDIKRVDKSLFAPVFVRYAFRLYDGSYIHQSVPLLLGAGYDSYLDVSAYKEVFGDIVMTNIDIKMPNAFKVKAYPRAYDIAKWSDIVQSLDIFISTDVCYPQINANFHNLEVVNEIVNEPSDATGSTYYQYEYKIGFDQGGLNDQQALEEELLSKSNFYKIASFSINDIYTSHGFDLVESDAIPYSQDDLLVQDRLQDYEQNNFLMAPSRLFAFNNRLFAVGDKRAIAYSYPGLQSLNIKWDKFPDTLYESYAFAYYIRDIDGNEHKVIMPSYYGEYAIDGKVARPYGMIFHPDSRCFKVEILNNMNLYTVTMKPHPFLNCAYGYWGLSKKITDLEITRTGVTDEEFFSGENRYETDKGRLYQSAADYPFYFPLAGNKLFSSPILGIAAATKALSQGQFGQFPLFIFTEDGIWAAEIADDGSAIKPKSLSREICCNPKSITPIEQGVLFMSEKGLMMLEGDQVIDLSPNMNGRHYSVDDTAKGIIKQQPGFESLIETLTDSSSFLSFMKEAELGYDYVGKRIICFNRNEEYQYLYKIDTRTWHKIFSTTLRFSSPINSYPKCEVMGESDGVTKIIDLSTVEDDTEFRPPVKGVIASRTFDLGEPDVYKTITDIRVRGDFRKGAVKFILQGTQDGIHFFTISTLRGKAWKRFRIILLTDLDVHERISWIDIQYENRFTYRLR